LRYGKTGLNSISVYEGSRYVTQFGEDGESYEAAESLFYVETRMTSQMMENTYVPLGGDVYSRLAELAKTDSQVAELLGRAAPFEVEGSKRGPMQPYTSLGVTAPSDRLPDGRYALAPELMIAERISLLVGAQIFHQTKNGSPILVAEYKQNHEGGRYWDVSADCPEKYRVNFEQLAKKGKR
jgi:hypothetical protein